MPSRILMSINPRIDRRFSISLLTSAAVTVFRPDRTTGSADEASLAASSSLVASRLLLEFGLVDLDYEQSAEISKENLQTLS